MASTDIVIVDDNAAILDNLSILFRGRYSVRTFEKVADALEYIQKHAFRLLITDQRMPELSGLMLAFEAKRLYPSIKVIVISAFLDEQSRHKRDIMSRFTDCFLEKPFSLTDIVNSVARLMANQVMGSEQTQQDKHA